MAAAGLFLLQRAPEAITALAAGPDPKALLWALIMLVLVARERPDDLAETKLTYCYDLSAICAVKFRLLRVSMTLAAAGLVLFLVYTAIG